MPLAEAIRRHVVPGLHLHLASTPSRSNAAIRELARAFIDTRPGFTLSSTGFHSMAHLLPRLGLASRLIGCFFGDHYPAPRPNSLYAGAVAAGMEIEHWPLWSLIASLRAGAQGDRWVVNRSLHGTTMAVELAARGAYCEVATPGEPGPPIGLCAATRPDVTFVHAAAADDEGHVLMSGPLSEGPWSALAARRGVIVTVERIVSAAVTRAHRAAIVLPPHRVLAVCEEPFGAHPQPLLVPPELDVPSYRDDFAHYERWRAVATDDAELARFVEDVVRAADGAAAYRAYVGAAALDQLRVSKSPGRGGAERPREGGAESPRGGSESRDATRGGVNGPAQPVQSPVGGTSPLSIDQMIVAGARQLALRARAIGAEVLIAGIGQAFFAARLAQRALAASGYALRVMVETGLYDLDCGPDGHGYLLAYENMARARRSSAIDDILGVLVGGADNRCIAALGAAQIDPLGNLNSTRLGGKLLVGSGGACDIAALAAEVVVMTRLGPGRLVDELEYITSPGHAVRSIVTDRCVLTRPDPRDPHAGGWTIASLLPAPAADTVAGGLAAIERACPWRLTPAADLGFAPPITEDEAHLLEILDPTGKYRHRAG
jgi:acyl CoA:acetate/3-ketoacid CoA transferase beta subunit/acyl CoA:acetate/3-ketoacid CoA transferase alpha subunit